MKIDHHRRTFGVVNEEGNSPRLEPEGTPRVVEAVRVSEADIVQGSAVLGVAGLHPEDVLWDPALDGDGKAAHAAAAGHA